VDVAYKIVNQKTFPGWGYMLESGATTFWEDWNFSDNTYSHNHSMFGSVSAWFYSALAGIQPAPDAKGFDKIIIKPQITGDLTWVKGSYNSIHGQIISDWQLAEGTLNMDVTIPVNTTATVFVPARDAMSVTEGGKPADQADGVTFLRMEKETAVYRVNSGSYTFTTKFTGVKSTWNGFDRYDFKFDGRDALVVVPEKAADGRPWVWRARFFADPPEVDIELLKNGFHVAYIDLPGFFGSPTAVAIWDRFYKYLTETYNFSGKVALEGTSRGGLFVFNWAARNPGKVSCIYADAPVCDIKSWPAGKLKGEGNPKEWANLLKAYNMTEEEALKARCNPIDHLEPLAKEKIPLLHVVGDADIYVPVSENTAIVEQKYIKLGGQIEVIHKPGVGHEHGLDDPSPIVDFIIKNTTDAMNLKKE
jgi:pimeloyl-ACP methyl ester carboxylesterase